MTRNFSLVACNIRHYRGRAALKIFCLGTEIRTQGDQVSKLSYPFTVSVSSQEIFDDRAAVLAWLTPCAEGWRGCMYSQFAPFGKQNAPALLRRPIFRLSICAPREGGLRGIRNTLTAPAGMHYRCSRLRLEGAVVGRGKAAPAKIVHS